jgi:hypothetical protein
VQVLHPSERLVGDDEWAVDVVADRAALPPELAATANSTPTPVPNPTGYRLAATIEQAMAALAARYPQRCSYAHAPNRTHQGRRVGYVTLGTPGKPIVVLTGGLHAREWAPPEALMSLVTALLAGELSHPAFARAGASYAAYVVPAAQLKAILAGVQLVVMPLANPDGHDFTLARLPAHASVETVNEHRAWRKNLRPGPSGSECNGVDINRNHAVIWDFENYYTASAATVAAVSTDPCNDTYSGPAAASEPETLNIQWLIDQHAPSWFCDVHSYSRDVLYPWGADSDQSSDATQNWRNQAWDRNGAHGGRPVDGGYGEYLEADLIVSHKALATRMAAACAAQAGPDRTAQARSAYTAKPELSLYPTTGTTTDYALGAWQQDPSRPTPHTTVIECGDAANPDDPGDDDGGFWPDYATAYPKVEREVHAALIALLNAAIDA